MDCRGRLLKSILVIARVASRVSSSVAPNRWNLSARTTCLGVLAALISGWVGAAEATINPPSQFIAKMYTEALGRMPDSSGWQAYLNYFNANGCSQATLHGIGRGFYLGTEYTNLNYGPAAKVLTSYRGILNREPDQSGFNDWYNYLGGGGNLGAMIDSFFGSAEFANLVPSICGTAARKMSSRMRQSASEICESPS